LQNYNKLWNKNCSRELKKGIVMKIKGLHLVVGVFLFAGCASVFGDNKKELNPQITKCSKLNKNSNEIISPTRSLTSEPTKKPFVSDSCIISNIPGLVQNCIITLEGEGIGVAPTNTISVAQATAMARRAAILDAYKVMVEKLYGIKINDRETVKNMVLQNSNLRSYLEGVIRGASIVDENYQNGLYKVRMSLKVNVRDWNKYLSYNPPYTYGNY
jgi:hypothetical protein